MNNSNSNSIKKTFNPNKLQWNRAHGKIMHSPKATTEFRILQRQDAVDRLTRLMMMALNEDNVFQSDQYDDFDSDVVEDPTAQTMFMANLSSVDPIYDEAGPSYDSDIISEVRDHDDYIDSVGAYHEVHKMQNDIQPNYVVDSDDEYTSDSNIIPYEQYVKDNAVQVVQSNVSSVPNDALMMIINDIQEQSSQCVSANEQNKVVNESSTAKLARYKQQVELYEKRARSQKMKELFEQMEAEVEQNVVDKQCADIEWKNWKRISEKRTKKSSKNDKTEHGMEKHGKDKVKSKPKTKKPTKDKVKTEAI
ncbi:hypothetical protein Tco_1428341 [Tanacetum coccineum]